MPYIPPEVLQDIKKVDLKTYLKEYEPRELVHFSGDVYTTRTHDSIKISNGKWTWWGTDIGGRTALDYLIKVRGLNFMEAAEFMFVQLVNSGDKTFANEIVYLDKDIVVNKGDAEDWAKGENTENLIAWVPIGTSTNKFAGTFDGKSHSISGIYLNNVNSSQQGVANRNAGSVVGYHLDGTLDIASTYGYAKNGIGVSGGYNTTHVTSGEIVGSATNITSINDIYGINVFDGKLDTTFWEARENDVPIPRKLAYLLDETELVRVDISWDDGNKNIQLSDSADLYGLALLSQKKDFNGYTFTLANNIVVNDVLITETSSKTGLKTWLPIGNSTHPFAGTFNGNGYSISGIYLNASTQSLQGLFSITSTGAVLQNFSLLNSYISGYDDTGAIVGKLVGTVQSVYNEAFVAGRNKVGGLVGTVDGMSDISSCWNAGNIKAGDGTTSGAYVGGIVGYINAGETNISHCLNTGNIHFGNQQAGGIVGQVYSATTINDCLNIGKITTGHTNGVTKRNAGSVVGYHVDGILTISSTYGYAENSIGVSSGYDAGKVAGEEIVGSATKITDCTTFYDASALVSNKLDYHFWTARKAAVPVPTGVAHTIDSSDIFAINTSWDSGNETNITLSNMADLYGFALLSQSKNFAGYTFTLSKNIVVNDDSITEETNKETLIDWIPIGNKDNIFAGNFDGAGHSISGVYAKGTSNIGLFYATTGTLMDFRLENSWFEGSGNYVASVVANYATGTIDKVYSNATVRSKGEVAGGLVGSVNASGKLTMSECWFAGSVKATGYAGTSGPGYEIGGLVGEVKDKCTLELTHTLNTGSVYSNGKRVGGLIGAVTGTGQASISDSLNAGKTEGLDYVGTIIGYITATSVVDFGENTTYGINDYASTAIGKIDTTDDIVTGTVQMSTIKDRLIGYAGTTAGLNFTNYWSLINEGTPVLKAFVGEGKVVAESETYKGDINELLQLSYWDDVTIANAEDKGTGNYMITIGDAVLDNENGTTENSYYGYLAALAANGFTAYSNDNGLNDEGVYNAIYTMGLDTTDTVSDDWVVNVTYISYKENDSVTPKIYITFNTGQPLSAHLKATNVASVDYSATDGYSVAQDKVTYHMLESSYAGFGAGSYIMQLKNGHFVVIDGGVFADVGYLFEYLESLAVDENGNQLKPIIEAWVFSHQHGDHMGPMLGIKKNVDTYKDRIYVEGFYYNEPSGEIIETYEKSAYELSEALKYCASQVLSTTENKAPQIYRMQTGQRYTFDDVEMDIMLSQELLTLADYQATYNVDNSYQQDSFNDTSTWCMFTIGEGSDAQKLLTAGDASYSGKNYICDMYSESYMTVDVFTALHHGFNTNMYNFPDSRIYNSDLQEEFSKKLTVTGVVLYSYKYDMLYENTTPNNNNQYAVNWKYAKLNYTFIQNYLAGKSDTFKNGIPVLIDGVSRQRTHFAKTRKATISVCPNLPLSNHLLKQDLSDIKHNAQTKLHMLKLSYMGNSFVIQLKNGHFIISDGGTWDDTEYLLEYMESLVPEGEKPIVEAWVLSHAHSDHVGALYSIPDIEGRAERICVEGVYFSEPNDDVIALFPVCAAEVIYTKEAIKELRTSEGDATPIYRPQTGQRYYFDDVTMDIVHSQEHLTIEEYSGDINDSSTWVMFTIEGQKCLFCGDGESGSQKAVRYHYDEAYLKLDVFTLPHHGHHTRDEFTDYIEVKTVLATVKEQVPAHRMAQNERLKEKANEWLVWGDGTKVLAFPYKVGYLCSV